MSNLDGVYQFNDYSISSLITENVVNFLKWGFLELGAYRNISVGQLDFNGQDESRLVNVQYPTISNYTIFKTAKHQIVWESGITLKPTGYSQPTVGSGIDINGVFVANNTSISGRTWHLDYSRGCVVFSSAVPSSWIIRLPHAQRRVMVYPTDGMEYRTLVSDWIRTHASGNYTSKELAYIPAVFVQVNNMDTIRGVSLGTRGKVSLAEIQFDVFANNPSERDKIVDILYMLETKGFKLYDVQRSPKPLNVSGQIQNQYASWPYLSENYTWGIGRFAENASSTKIRQNILPIYHTRLRIGLELEVYPY